jgi:hypothetical protein
MAAFRAWRCFNPRTRIVFTTFADETIYSSSRLVTEINATYVFDKVIAYRPDMLGEAFWTRYAEHMRHKRGFGYWIWKPYIIQQQMATMNDGDLLVYADSGCSTHSRSRPKLCEAILRTALSKESIMVNVTSTTTIAWTKADLLRHFECSTQECLDALMIESNRIVLVVTERNRQFVHQWLSLSGDLHLIDDSPSASEEDRHFIEHRHDQSIFCLLIYQRPFLRGIEKALDASRLKK